MPARVHLKLMWDYDAFPLWNDGHGLDAMQDPRALPLSDGLRLDLQAWSDEWTNAVWGNGGPDARGWKPPSDAHRADWDRRGRELWRRVQEELGDGFVVGYFDELTGKMEKPTTR